jgi:RNA polymerase sigma factor (sigma-70 family)
MSPNAMLERLQSDDQKQLGLIYEQYREEFLHWIVKNFHCCTEDSQDIYQCTILIFYDNVRSGKLQHLVSSVKTYLFAIGKNVAREHLREAGRNNRLQNDKLLKEHFLSETDDHMDESFFEAASNALAKLDGPRRRLIELYYYERKSMEEISSILHYSNADTAKNQKCKSMVRLRQLFQEELKKVPVPTLPTQSPEYKSTANPLVHERFMNSSR